MDYIALGKRIREERLKLHMTQEQLVEEANLSTSYIGQIERGERSLSLETLIALVNRLGVTVDYLLQESVNGDTVPYKEIWLNLLSQASDEEKEMIVNMTKLLLNYKEKES